MAHKKDWQQQPKSHPTYGVDGDDNRFRVKPGPGDMDVELVDVAGDKREGQTQLTFQHVQAQVQVAKHCITSP